LIQAGECFDWKEGIMQGTITIIDRGAVRVHSYMAPDASVNVTSQIIETPHALVVVDGQFLQAFANEAALYAASLGKPIERLIISHAHPDHYAGASEWNAPIVSLPVVREAIIARGDVTDPTGRVVPVGSVTPEASIEPGDELIDGTRFSFELLTGGEAHDQLLITLPDHGILVAQDLVYNNVHLYFGEDDIVGWQQALNTIASHPRAHVVLAGHGLPTTMAVIDELRHYLTDAERLLQDDGDAYKAAIIEAYPNYGGRFIIDIANRYLFGAATH